MKAFLASAALATALTVAGPASAFPDRPLEIVVPFSAGGGTDAMVRIFAEHMAEELGSAVVVGNRPGAGAKTA